MNINEPAGQYEFERAFLPLGHRAPDSDVWDTLRASARRIPEKLRNEYGSEIFSSYFLDFIDNECVNGAVTFRNGWALVACNTGVPKVFTTLFSFLLSQPDCLIGIGDESRERRWIESLTNCDWAAGRETVLQQMSIRELVVEITPNDKIRKNWVALLSNTALEFFYRHEIGHLILGHVPMDGTVSQERGNPTYDQFNELEADAWAMRSLVGDALRLVGNEYFPTQSSAISSITIALFFVFLIFDDQSVPLSEYRRMSHPHPAVRMASFVGILDGVTKDKKAQKMISEGFALSYMAALSAAETLDIRGASLSMLEYENEIGDEYLRIVDAGNQRERTYPKSNRPLI